MYTLTFNLDTLCQYNFSGLSCCSALIVVILFTWKTAKAYSSVIVLSSIDKKKHTHTGTWVVANGIACLLNKVPKVSAHYELPI